MTQQRIALAAVGAAVLLALALFVWALQPTPVPFVPPPPPTRAEVPRPKPKRVRTPLPPPVEIPDGAVDEALIAVAVANEVYRVRCSVPDEVTARGVPLRYATWEGREVTMVVASSTGTIALRDLQARPGRQTAGNLLWRDVELGTTGVCSFEPSAKVALEVELTGLDEGKSYMLFVCDEANKVEVIGGRATIELPTHEVCLLRVHRVDEFHMPRMFTTSGDMIPLRPTASGTLKLEVVDRSSLTEEELEAINETAAVDARAFMGVPARPKIDLDAVLKADDLSPGARAWLEQQRR